MRGQLAGIHTRGAGEAITIRSAWMSDTMQLPCQLTQQELDIRRDELAELQIGKDRLRWEYNEYCKRYRKSLRDLERSISRLSAEIHSKQQLRDVRVTREKRLEAGVEITVRDDSGEVVSQRGLEPDEYQREMF